MNTLQITVNGKEKLSRELSTRDAFEVIGDIVTNPHTFKDSEAVNLEFNLDSGYLKLIARSSWPSSGKLKPEITGILDVRLSKMGDRHNIGIIFGEAIICRSGEIRRASGIFEKLGKQINAMVSPMTAVDLWFFNDKEKNQYAIRLYINGQRTSKLVFSLLPEGENAKTGIDLETSINKETAKDRIDNDKSTENRIISARIAPAQKFGDVAKIYVFVGSEQFSETSLPVEQLLFTYFDDEISFTESEFIGLTLAQANNLKYNRDLGYIRS